MALIGESVDDWDAGVLSEEFDGPMFMGSQHDAVDHSRDHASGILDGFTATQLSIPWGEKDRSPTQLDHSCFKGDARAS